MRSEVTNRPHRKAPLRGGLATLAAATRQARYARARYARPICASRQVLGLGKSLERGEDRDELLCFLSFEFPPGAPLRRGGVLGRPVGWGIPHTPRPLTLASSLRVGPLGV